MKISNTPPAVMARLLALTEQVEALGQAADAAEQKVANARAVLNGQTIPRNFSKGDFAQLRNGFDELLRSANSARHAARIEQTLLANAKQWIETLPSDTVLEPMRVAVDGADLQTVRSSLKIKRERLRVLKLLPLPAPDIAQQVTAYVANLAKLGAPVIRDLQRLQIYWPQHADRPPATTWTVSLKAMPTRCCLRRGLTASGWPTS